MRGFEVPNDEIELRHQQYLNALSFYINSYDYDILFLDNSNHDLSEIHRIIKNRGIVVQTHEDFPDNKKCGEFFLMRSGIFSRIASSYRNIIKITGRLMISNLSLNIKPKNIYSPYFSDKYISIDSWLMAGTVNDLRNVFDWPLDQLEINQSIFEQVIANRIIKLGLNICEIDFNYGLSLNPSYQDEFYLKRLSEISIKQNRVKK